MNTKLSLSHTVVKCLNHTVRTMIGSMLFLVATVGDAGAQIDVNPNGSFEIPPDSTGAVEGWAFNLGGTGAADFVVVNEPVKDGERALAITVNSTGTNAWDVEALNAPVPVVPGETYRYSIWARASQAGATAHFTVGNPSFQEHYRNEQNGNINTEWQLFSSEFTVPSTETSTTARAPIHFSFAANVGVTVYIDSLRITQITGLPEPLEYPLIVEAESGTIGAEFDTLETDDGSIRYLSIRTDFNETSGATGFPGENRTIAYQVTFPDTGIFDLFARIRVGPDGFDDDSFFYGNGFGVKDPASTDDWILVNGMAAAGFADPSAVVREPGGLGNGEWKWVNLSRNPFQGSVSLQFSVASQDSLTQTFMLGARENGLDLDKIAFGRSSFFFTVANLDSVQPGSATDPTGEPVELMPIAAGKDKWLGNVYSSSQLPRYTEFWNQVTPENAGKWGSVEGSRDVMNWGQMDAAYALAKDNGFPFRYHVLVWGNQQPAWIETLSTGEQREEIEEWFAAVAERYPDIDYLEVVNEPLHDPPNQPGNGGGNYIDALGGTGETGWDWVIAAFEIARPLFPNTRLMVNDYNIVNDNNATTTYLQLINLLLERNLIDGIGVQAHAFSTRGAMTTVTGNLDRLSATGLPILATEMDIDGPSDQVQLEDYQRIFPTFWEHPGVMGITLWGWRPGMWRTDQQAFLITDSGEFRPALDWLRMYVETPPTSVARSDGARPAEFRVHNNYPNPFNPATQISYEIPRTAKVTLQVFDITGRLVQTLVNDVQGAGKYNVIFEANNLASGVYFYRLSSDSFIEVKRMLLIK